MRTHINVSDLTRNVDELIDAIDILIRKADDDLEEQLTAEGYVEAKKAVKVIGELEEGWTAAYNADCDSLLEQLEKALSVDGFVENTWPKIKSNTDLRDAIYDVFHDRFTGLMKDCVNAWLKGDDPELAPENLGILSEPAKAFVESWSSQLAGLMHLGTKDQIEKILIDAQKDHLSVAQVTQKISDSGIREPGYKARRAAITEVLRAESYGQLEAMRQNPAIKEKEWEHTGAYRNKPRENHVAMNGKRVPVDEPFELKGADGGTYYPMCPRDASLPASESVNCHCLMRQIKDPKWNDLTAEEKQAAREQRLKELNETQENVENSPNSANIDTREMANGLRTSPFYVLKEQEIDSIISDAKDIGIPIELLVFNEGTSTGYNDRYGVIFIRGDVLPDLTSTNNRDLLSQRAVLAHEYYGHYLTSGTALPPGDWRDEFRASYRAATLAPNLSDEERQGLMRDAVDRASEAGVSIKLNSVMRRILYGFE